MNIPFLITPGSLAISLREEKAAYSPGERLAGTVELSTTSVHARSLTISLRCYEFVKVSCGSGSYKMGGGSFKIGSVRGSYRIGSGSRASKEEWLVIYSTELVLGGEGDYSVMKRDFEFTIPRDAPPTIARFPGDLQESGAGVKWELHAKLDVPWGVDLNARKTIFVR